MSCRRLVLAFVAFGLALPSNAAPCFPPAPQTLESASTLAERDDELDAAATGPFELGVDAYRRGEYGEADAHWRKCLDQPLSDDDRARVTFNLGNAAWRRDDGFSAVGWYTAAVRSAPRHTDAWHNLEFVRSQQGLEPADRGDLGATVRRLLGLLRPGEARTLAAIGLFILALTLLVEALRGGRFARLGAAIGVFVFVLCSIPWLWDVTRADGDPLLVVRAPSVALRSEPRLALEAIDSLDGGEEVERIDELPGWVRVETTDGTRGWVQADAVFALSTGRKHASP